MRRGLRTVVPGLSILPAAVPSAAASALRSRLLAAAAWCPGGTGGTGVATAQVDAAAALTPGERAWLDALTASEPCSGLPLYYQVLRLAPTGFLPRQPLPASSELVALINLGPEGVDVMQ